MTFSFETSAQQEIWQIVQQINDSWSQGRLENLEKFFHEEVVFVAPGFQNRLEGRAACVDSFRDFCSKAKVRELKVKDPAIDVVAGTAVVTYGFEIEYDMNGESFSDSGRDVWVFVRDQDEWRAVWRTIVDTTAR